MNFSQKNDIVTSELRPVLSVDTSEILSVRECIKVNHSYYCAEKMYRRSWINLKVGY